MATIDVDELRDYMISYYGTAMMSGLPTAVLDMVDVEGASGQELCRIAEDAGIDLRNFTVND